MMFVLILTALVAGLATVMATWSVAGPLSLLAAPFGASLATLAAAGVIVALQGRSRTSSLHPIDVGETHLSTVAPAIHEAMPQDEALEFDHAADRLVADLRAITAAITPETAPLPRRKAG